MADSLIIQACTAADELMSSASAQSCHMVGHCRSTFCMAPSMTLWPSCGHHCSASTSNIHPGSRACQGACSSARTYKLL